VVIVLGRGSGGSENAGRRISSKIREDSSWV
jgi:hypothetical protein